LARELKEKGKLWLKGVPFASAQVGAGSRSVEEKVSL